MDRCASSRATRCRSARAKPHERRRLGLEASATVARITRVRYLDEQPVIVERIVVPESLFPGLGSRPVSALPNTLYALYESEFGIPVASAQEDLRAVAARDADARALGVAPGAPLLEIDRLAYGHGGQAVEWRVSRCHTDRHHYRNRLV